MSLLKKVFVGALALCFLMPAFADAAVINEARIDQTSTDNDEYFELAGDPGESLDGLTYVVIGDGTGGSGVIENATDLTGNAIPADGHFLCAESTFGAVGSPFEGIVPDFIASLNFENSDNVTHLLVSDFTGTVGDDLDVDEDGNLDNPPWSAEVDCVAFIETVGSGDLVYCGTQVGPDGTYVPGHIYLCSTTWMIGPFEPVGGKDTPGTDNSPSCIVPTEETSWGSMKSRF